MRRQFLLRLRLRRYTCAGHTCDGIAHGGSTCDDNVCSGCTDGRQTQLPLQRLSLHPSCMPRLRLQRLHLRRPRLRLLCLLRLRLRRLRLLRHLRLRPLFLRPLCL